MLPSSPPPSTPPIPSSAAGPGSLVPAAVTVPPTTTTGSGRRAAHVVVTAAAAAHLLLHGHALAASHLLGEGFVRLAHLGIPEVHLPVEMIGQAPVVVEPAEVGAAHVADLQLLVSRGPAGVGQGLELALALGLGGLGLADAEHLVVGAGDLAHLAEDLDLGQARGDGGAEVGYGPEELVGLANLVGRLLESALGRVDPPVALVDVLLEVAEVVVVEAVLLAVKVREGLVLGLERVRVHARARAEVLLGVGEEVVRAGADQVGPADFRVGEGELRALGRDAAAHELLWIREEGEGSRLDIGIGKGEGDMAYAR